MTRQKNIARLATINVGLLVMLWGADAFAQQSIMIAGDSISGGHERPSYRQSLLDSLGDLNCSVDMVGSLVHNDFKPDKKAHFGNFKPSNGYDVDHQGWPGITIEKFNKGGKIPNGDKAKPVGFYVDRYQPNFVVLHLGTNNLHGAVRAGADTSKEITSWAKTATTELKSSINRIIKAHSNPADLKIIVANFIPSSPDSFNAVKTLAAIEASKVFTSRIEKMVKALSNSNVVTVDVATGFDINSMTIDGTHPNATGEKHIADAVLASLLDNGLCDNSSGMPDLVDPSPGSTLSGPTVTFKWDSDGIRNIDDWRMRVGDANDKKRYANKVLYVSTRRSYKVSGLPTDGSKVLVNLAYKKTGGKWVEKEYSFNAASNNGNSNGNEDTGNENTGNDDGTSSMPAIVSPASGSTLSGSVVTFKWSDNGTKKIDDWRLLVGSANDETKYANKILYVPTKRQFRVQGLPTDGSNITLKFSYRTVGGAWIEKEYSYKAASKNDDDGSTTDSEDSSNNDGNSSDGSGGGGSSGDGGDNSGGGNASGSPPALNLSKVKWLHTDVSKWSQGAKLSSVKIEGSKICLNYNKADEWRAINAGGTKVVGNPWVFIWNKSDKKWYGATWEWLRPGQTCKALKAVNGDHIKKTPYTASSGWKPKSGETLYFMVSGTARNGARNVQQRTQPVKFVWP